MAVVGKSEPELNSALDRLITAGLLFRQGMPPFATYLFKHVLVQDAAYGTLLRKPRRALHARVAETLESQFAEITGTQPELLARQYTDAGLIEKAAGLWGKAGQRSLERSALLEAVAKFTRGLDQIATLAGSPALRSQQIKLQVGLANALYHMKGFSAAVTKAAFDKARAMIERAEALANTSKIRLCFTRSFTASSSRNSSPSRARRRAHLQANSSNSPGQKATPLIMIGHRLLGTTLLCLGEPTEGLEHLDQALVLYEPAAHRSLTTHFGHDVGVATLTLRSLARWLLGYPETALVEINHALNAARETVHAPTLMFALGMTTFTQICCRNYARANPDRPVHSSGRGEGYRDLADAGNGPPGWRAGACW